MSKDTEFQPKGSATGINYQLDYWKYRKILSRADNDVHKDLIDFFNRAVFPSRVQAPSKKDSDEDDNEPDVESGGLSQNTLVCFHIQKLPFSL